MSYIHKFLKSLPFEKMSEHHVAIELRLALAKLAGLNGELLPSPHTDAEYSVWLEAITQNRKAIHRQEVARDNWKTSEDSWWGG